MLLIRLTHVKCMGVNGKALQLYAPYKKPYFYYTLHENLYQYYKSCKNLYQYYKSCTLRLNVQ